MTDRDLYAWRLAMKLSQAQAARALNVPLQTYLNWEKGRRPAPSAIDRLAAYITDHGVPVVEGGRIVAYQKVLS